MSSRAVAHSILASKTDRFLAWLMDMLCVGLLCLVPVIGWLLGIAYFFMKDALSFLHGQSVGKRIRGIKVVNASTLDTIDGDYGTSAKRSLLFLVPVLNLIDGFMVFSADHRRFGDILAETIVIKH